uniref:Mitochondrial ribosomal protein S14 n=1 Tax=Panagrolaimus davidi TaxID=227884 RepID=A0A914PYT4_9BILA
MNFIGSPLRHLTPAVGVQQIIGTRFASTEATFQTRPYKLHKLDQRPAAETVLTKKDALDYYRKMQVIRRMETAAGNLYREKKMRGFCLRMAAGPKNPGLNPARPDPYGSGRVGLAFRRAGSGRA